MAGLPDDIRKVLYYGQKIPVDGVPEDVTMLGPGLVPPALEEQLRSHKTRVIDDLKKKGDTTQWTEWCEGIAYRITAQCDTIYVVRRLTFDVK